jgi:hypothetical protein
VKEGEYGGNAFKYENGTMRPVEVVLGSGEKRGVGVKGRCESN